MVDLRRWIFALALLSVFAGLASAQVTCSLGVSSTPPVRQEGYTELTGDIIVTCTGGPTLANGTTGAGVPLATFTVNLNAPVTSRLLGTGSEALLIVDEAGNPASGLVDAGFPQVASVPPGSTGNTFTVVTAAGGSTATSGDPNVFQGIVAGNTVSFPNVPIIPPGTTTRVFRIVNVRINATALAANAAISATVGINQSAGPPQTLVVAGSGAGLSIGIATPTLGTSVLSFTSGLGIPTAGAAVQQCIPLTRSALITLRFQETNSLQAFKPRFSPGTNGVQNVPGTPYAATGESGFIFPGFSSGGNIAGQADYGTRVKAVFSNVPAGVTLYAPVSGTTTATSGVGGASPSGTTAALTAFETAPFAQLTGTQTIAGVTGSVNLVPLTVNAGTATAVWEVQTSNSTTQDTLYFPIAITTATTTPAGTITVNLSYAPNPTQGAFSAAAGGAPSATLTIPRFADTSTAINAYNIQICRTVLLFPYVATTVGFETGIGISNTSTDPFGTTPQSGSCTLNFFGSGAPTTAPTTPTINSGTTFATAVGAGLGVTNFSGYLIAVCNFQLAHAYASLFNGFGTAAGVFSSYIANIIPDPATTGGVRTFAAGGEGLEH